MLAIIEEGARKGKTAWNNEDDFGLFKEVMHAGTMIRTLDMAQWQEEMLTRLRDDFREKGFKCEFYCWDASRFDGIPCGCTFTLKRKKSNK